MEKKYIAHINEELKTEQTVKEHSENVAMLAGKCCDVSRRICC